MLSSVVDIVDISLNADSNGNSTVGISVCEQAARLDARTLLRRQNQCEWVVSILDLILNLFTTIFYWRFARISYSYHLHLSGEYSTQACKLHCAYIR